MRFFIGSVSGCLEQRVDEYRIPPKLNSDAKGMAINLTEDAELVVREEMVPISQLLHPSLSKDSSLHAPFFPGANYGISPVFNSEGLLSGLQLNGEYPLNSLFVSVEVKYFIETGRIRTINNLFAIPKTADGFYEISQFVPSCFYCEDDIVDNNKVTIGFGLPEHNFEINLNPESLEKMMALEHGNLYLPDPCDFEL